MKKNLIILSLVVLTVGLSVSCKKDSPTPNPPVVVPEGFVDLGILNAAGKPLFWAKCNLGAVNPQDSGKYFFWGDVTGQTPSSSGLFNRGFDWENETFGENFEKVAQATACPDGILAPAYDAATRVDADWRIPTLDDIKALVGGCVLIWTDDYNNTGTCGFIVYKAKNVADKGKTDNNGVWKKFDGSSYGPGKAVIETYSISDTHIFLPAAGYGSTGSVTNEDGTFKYGYYWSSSFGTGLSGNACAMVFHRRLVSFSDSSKRQLGYSIRPVTE